ncbi:GIN domain-containing protein [Acetobacter orleanensis]|uniref:Putative auto-transporter adhesin head GIN domain-containing protein n=1 Tax=Acetobacter orleanensis TaxID=104099 RepID=A0A4Y3TP24_9PROT|nr:DUF2807 domain-containing protein [Acetobacter orleanensis]PCD80055.1 DUF2807 domain-containing protein [Acetobacter orleanensis]GAN68376.1 hypothetical protein Abol_015_215 [Acetobacter orleanensis JCM 7639]GBR29658.1 hypothetical protein AA0473_2075 [Acetobacter orleanensis NRIC 0473]GEB82777.1 hypothetical protein AOR01nite_12540 [Acetobacter orleanensis]
MIRGITMIALGGAALSALCFGMATVRGPLLFPSTQWTLDWAGTEPTGPTTTRTLDWQGSNALTLNLPARIIYTQGEKPGITVKGSERLVNRVTLQGNTLDMAESKDHHTHWSNNSLTVTITAPALNTLTLNDFGTLDVQDYQQPTLNLVINGAAHVKAHGHTDSLKLTIDGAGSVKLTSTPQSLTQQIDGIGSVSLPHKATTPTPPTPPQPHNDKTQDGESEENEDTFF